MSICPAQFRAYHKPCWLSDFATISPTSGQQVTKIGSHAPANGIIINDIESPKLGQILAIIVVLTESQRTKNNGYRQARSV